MSNPEPQGRPFQFSLWSLLVLTTVVSILCSIGVCTIWSFPIAIGAGTGLCVIGFGPLSLRKHPTGQLVFRIVGLLIRLTGLELILFGFMAFLDWLLGLQ
ncbi:MAG: hypothetical protein ACLP9L_38350 [Thermoguttaceae bacterium]